MVFERALLFYCTLQVPSACQPVLLLPPESRAAEYTAWLPTKLSKKKTLSVSVSPLPVAEEPAPLIWHWLF
jgi:hypothetical protein